MPVYQPTERRSSPTVANAGVLACTNFGMTAMPLSRRWVCRRGESFRSLSDFQPTTPARVLMDRRHDLAAPSPIGACRPALRGSLIAASPTANTPSFTLDTPKWSGAIPPGPRGPHARPGEDEAPARSRASTVVILPSQSVSGSAPTNERRGVSVVAPRGLPPSFRVPGEWPRRLRTRRRRRQLRQTMRMGSSTFRRRVDPIDRVMGHGCGTRPGFRTSIVHLAETDWDRKTAAWPAELPPPTSATSGSGAHAALQALRPIVPDAAALELRRSLGTSDHADTERRWLSATTTRAHGQPTGRR